MPTTYEVHYFSYPGRGDLLRMLLEVGGASYKNVFFDWGKSWPAAKETMAFGVMPKLTFVESDGSRKDLFESSAIVGYLAESLDLMPGPTAFERAEALSVLSALAELEDKIRSTLWLRTLDERKAGHATYCTETAPKYLKYQEGFVRGDWYFGDKLTVADLKLYQLYLWYEDMYSSYNQNPFKVLAADLPKLNKIIGTLEKGKAGEYARERRNFGKDRWVAKDWKFGRK